MITLSLLKFIENEGLGEIDVDLFFQKLTLDKIGVYITDIGTSRERGQRRIQTFELYSRGTNDVDGYKRLDKIIELLDNSYGVCKLPAVPPVTDAEYNNVTIMPVSTINSVGLDNNGKNIYSATGTIYY